MNEAALVLVVGVIQAVFAALDGLERWQSRRSRYAGERLEARTVGFLTATLLVYLAIQVGLIRLAPTADALLGFAGGLFPAGGRELGAAGVALVALVAFYGGGLCDYLVHRFFNHSRWFWWTHEYHHLPTQVFVVMPGLAVRPFSVFTVVPTALVTVLLAAAVTAALGARLDSTPLALVVGANAFVLTTSHSSFLRQWRWPHHLLRLAFITTPDEHLVHHTVDRPGNYGNLTTLWDRVFGTYRDPALPENQARELGLGYDQDFLGTLTFGRWKLPEAWRARVQLARYCTLGGSPAPRGPAESQFSANPRGGTRR